ncbi:MAG: alpha/beta hydrolase [Microthrixaceae bacterium]
MNYGTTRRRAHWMLSLGVVLAIAATACAPTTPPATGSMPATGRFSSELYTNAQLTEVPGVLYGTAENVNGVQVELRLDLFLPPAGGPAARPAAVVVHGGGFSGGTREQMAGTARTYARRGFVAASISYRLDPQASASSARYLSAAVDAIDDGMESVRWLRSNAATYGIDTSRISMIGSSAGGAVALGVAAADDPTPGGPLGGVSPTIAAAVSTGATLTPGIGSLITSEPTAPPSLMLHYQVHTYTYNPAPYTMNTCHGLVAAGAPCRFVTQSGSGHTVSLAAGGPFWSPEIGPFLWEHLRLNAIS